jgi:hypothetical protein
VFAPEGCFEATRFNRMLDERGVFAYSDLAMTKKLLD